METVVAGTYHTLDETSSISLLDMLQSVFRGMVEVSDIIFYMLIVGGAFELIRASSDIDAAVSRMTMRMIGKEYLLIPLLMVLFAVGGSVIALAEEAIPYITLLMPIMLRLGFDSITAAAVVLLGTGAGFTTAVMNPFTVGVAQTLADIPLFSGMTYRIIMGICFTILNTSFVMWYALKIKKNPGLRYIPEEFKSNDSAAGSIKMTNRHVLVLITIGLTIVLLMTGVIRWG